MAQGGWNPPPGGGVPGAYSPPPHQPAYAPAAAMPPLTALTVSLALAEGRLLHGLRGAMRHIDRIAAGLLIAAGAYLVYYWWYDVASDTGAQDVRGQGLVVWLQDRMTDVQNWLVERSVAWLVVVFGGIIAIGALILYGATRSPRAAGSSEP